MVIKVFSLQLVNRTGVVMTGGERSASAATLIATGKVVATPTVSESATSAAGAAPAGGATAEVVAEAGAVAEGRAGTESTEEAEVRKFPQHHLHTANDNSTRDKTQECASSCQ